MVGMGARVYVRLASVYVSLSLAALSRVSLYTSPCIPLPVYLSLYTSPCIPLPVYLSRVSRSNALFGRPSGRLSGRQLGRETRQGDRDAVLGLG